MSFPWERRLKAIEAQEAAAAERKADAQRKADTQAQNKAIATWYGQMMQQASKQSVTGQKSEPSSDGAT